MDGITEPLLVVAGPTASGKSGQAVELALALGGEVINIDSVQIYRDCAIGSAQITVAEARGVPHHLVAARQADEPCQASAFVSLAEEKITELRERARLPVLVGGTTLYLSALFQGLAELPAAQQSLRADMEKLSDEELHAKVTACDPESAARIHRHDRVRLIRALETFAATGTSLSQQHAAHRERPPRYHGLFLVLCWPRERLYERINIRAQQMIEQGLVRETKALLTTYGRDISVLRSLGFAEAVRYLEGALPEDKLADEIAQNTRRFAKRQMTFWRNEPVKRGWVIRPREDEAALTIAEESGRGRRQNLLKGFRALQYSQADLTARIKERLSVSFQRNEVWYVDAVTLFGLDS